MENNFSNLKDKAIIFKNTKFDLKKVGMCHMVNCNQVSLVTRNDIFLNVTGQ